MLRLSSTPARWRTAGAAVIIAATTTAIAGVAPATADDTTDPTPSTAQTVHVGVTYHGAENGHANVWRLPALLIGDHVQVAWASDDGNQVDVCLEGNVDDYDWGQNGNYCNLDYDSGISEPYPASGKSGRVVLSPESSAQNAFLILHKNFGGPYHFVVESIQHQIGVNLLGIGKKHVKRRGVVTARAALANGAAVPAGMRFKLKVKSGKVKRAYTATTSSQGLVRFKLHLPKRLRGHRAKFTVVRSATTTFLAASSPNASFRIK